MSTISRVLLGLPILLILVASTSQAGETLGSKNRAHGIAVFGKFLFQRIFDQQLITVGAVLGIFRDPIVLLSITQVDYSSPFDLVLSRSLTPTSPTTTYLEVRLLSSQVPRIFFLEATYLVTEPLFNVEFFPSVMLTSLGEYQQAALQTRFQASSTLKQAVLMTGFSDNRLSAYIKITPPNSTSSAYVLSISSKYSLSEDCWVQVDFVVINQSDARCLGTLVTYGSIVAAGNIVNQLVPGLSSSPTELLGLTTLELETGNFHLLNRSVEAQSSSSFTFSLIKLNTTCTFDKLGTWQQREMRTSVIDNSKAGVVKIAPSSEPVSKMAALLSWEVTLLLVSLLLFDDYNSSLTLLAPALVR